MDSEPARGPSSGAFAALLALGISVGAGCGARTGLPTERVDPDGGNGCALDPGSATTLATDALEPREVALDANNAYWADWGTVANHFSDGAVVQKPLCGGPTIVLATSQQEPIAITVDATHVYWANQGAADAATDGAILAAPIGGGDVKTLAAGLVPAMGMAVDGTSVYWISPTEVSKVPLGGGTVTALASGQLPTGIAIDATSVYWTDAGTTGSLKKVPLEGGAVTVLLPAASIGYTGIGGIAVDATSIYFGTVEGGILATDLSGGNLTTLATGQSSASGLATDSASLYWATGAGLNGAGDIMKLSLATRQVSTLVPHGGISIAVNEAVVAWTALDGNVVDQGVVQIAPK